MLFPRRAAEIIAAACARTFLKKSRNAQSGAVSSKLRLLLIYLRYPHPQQLLGHLWAFRAHDVVLHIVPGKEVHAAVPHDLFIDNGKMLTVILNQADLPAGGAQAFQQGKAMLALAVAIGIRVPGDGGCLQTVLLCGLQEGDQ